MTITGNNLANATEVKFGTTVVSSSKFSDLDGTIEVRSPKGKAGTVNVTVVTAGGTSPGEGDSPGDDFTYVAVQTVSHVSPAAGPLTATHGRRSPGPLLNVRGVPASPWCTLAAWRRATSRLDSWRPRSGQSPGPEGSGSVNVTVVTAGGISHTSTADKFTVAAAPTISSLSRRPGRRRAALGSRSRARTCSISMRSISARLPLPGRLSPTRRTAIVVMSPQDTGRRGRSASTSRRRAAPRAPPVPPTRPPLRGGLATVNAGISASSPSVLSATPATAPSLVPGIDQRR